MSEKSFKEWYGDNKEDYNAKRRARYHGDKEYRKRVQSYTRRYREGRPQKESISGGVFMIKVNGKTVKGYRTGAVAVKLGVKAEAIRYLEKKGYILKAVVSGKNRTYTFRQISLIKKAFDARYRFNNGMMTQEEVTAVKETIKREWV